jgi:sodium/bile acid cotransporter 7
MFEKASSFYKKYQFLIHIAMAIVVALAHPPIGHKYVAAEYTSEWVAVIAIFVMQGLSLKLNELKHAVRLFKFNAFLQLFNLGFIPIVVFAVSRLLLVSGILIKDMCDGMVVTACLPMTINMVLVLTASSNGNEACALLNATVGNFLGVFLTPAYLMLFLGQDSDIKFFDVVLKLSYRVLLPTIVGLLLQNYVKCIRDFSERNKQNFSKAGEYLLVFIVFTVFSTTFAESDSGVAEGPQFDAIQILICSAFVMFLLFGFMIFGWWCMKTVFKGEPKLVVMGFFGCHHKTVAMGIPMIKAIYEGNPKMGLYILPLLIWHPV